MNDVSDRANVTANIAYDDLREWLDYAERLGEVRHIKGASWQEDIGLAAEAILRAENGPCVVFEDVPGCPKGFRVLLNMFAGVRRNMTLGFPDHLTKWELSDAYREAYLKDQKIIPHEIVDDGPVFENILTGDAIDVTKFPSPIWHEKDGGRYIGTGTYCITRDPEENWLNAGAYRAHGARQDLGRHADWRPAITAPFIARNISSAASRCRSCMVLGGDPLVFLLRRPRSALRHVRDRHRRRLARPADEDGARQGHRPAASRPAPRSCSKAMSRPTSASIEGPFGEWTGHYAGGAKECRCSTSRRSITATTRSCWACRRWAAGRTRWRAIARCCARRRSSRTWPMPACPDVQQVWCHEIGGARMFHGVSIKQRYPGHAVQAGHIAAQCGASAYASKYIVVVDDDVDVTNLDQLLWAMLTRTDPKESIQFIEGSWDSPADPRLSPEKRASRRHDPFGCDHRCLPALALARQVPADQRAQRGGRSQGQGEIRLAAGRQKAGLSRVRRQTRKSDQTWLLTRHPTAGSARACCARRMPATCIGHGMFIADIRMPGVAGRCLRPQPDGARPGAAGRQAAGCRRPCLHACRSSVR